MIYTHPMTRGWIYSVDGEPVGFAIARYNKGIVDQIEAIAGNVKKMGIFREYARAMIAIFQEWCISENAKRVVFMTSTNFDVWKRHLKTLCSDKFLETNIKENTTITWECSEKEV
jgi:hypothetical protein